MPSSPSSQPFPLQPRTGPYTFLLPKSLGGGGFTPGVGEEYNSYIVAPDGYRYYIKFIGGEQQQMHIYCSQGISLGEPTFQAPLGATVLDYLTQYVWISQGWADADGNPGPTILPANNVNVPAEGLITATNFLGWTAYCPCIPGVAMGSGSGTGSGSGGQGGGDDLIVTKCCPQGVKPTLFLAITNGCDPGLNGNFILKWNSDSQWWQSIVTLNINNTPVTYILYCDETYPQGQWLFVVSQESPPNTGGNVATWTHSDNSNNCGQPFSLSGSGGPNSGNLTSIGCGSPQSLSWSIDD